MMGKAKSGQHSYQDLIDFHTAISLLSLEEISAVLVDRLPSSLSIHYFTLFLYDKDKRTLNLMCHNRPDIESSGEREREKEKRRKEERRRGNGIAFGCTPFQRGRQILARNIHVG